MWGSYLIVSPTRFRYFVTFVDDYSQTTWLYLMKNRYELFSHFYAFCDEIHTQFHVSVQCLRSDNVKEYVSEQFQLFMLQMASFISPPVLILPLIMEWLRGRIDTSLKLLERYYFKCMCPRISGPMLFPLLVFLLTRCPSPS